MREHLYNQTLVSLLTNQPTDIDTVLLARSPDGQPATPEDRTLLDRASASADDLKNADIHATTPFIVVSAPTFRDGMFGEYVALERSIQDGLQRASDLGARTITMSPIADDTITHWPADRAAYVLWNTIFRFLSERGTRPAPAAIQVLLERDGAEWSTALDKVVGTMLG